MITIDKWLRVINYQITGGHDYQWRSFGPDAYGLESDSDDYSFGILFDKKDQTVYQVSVCDYRNDRAYRMSNPKFVDAYRAEAAKKQISSSEAWEGVDFVELETVTDFVEKAEAIISNN